MGCVGGEPPSFVVSLSNDGGDGQAQGLPLRARCARAVAVGARCKEALKGKE